MRDSPDSVRGGKQAEKGFSAGLFKRAGQEPEAFCDFGNVSYWEKLCRIATTGILCFVARAKLCRSS